MALTFKKAERSQQKLRAAIDGPSGAGKTFSALRLGFSLIDAGLGTKLALIDTENGSASLYAGESPDGKPWDFDTLTLSQFNPDQYVAAIGIAEKAGYDVIVIDSLSHAWQGKGGVLDIVDQKGGKFTAWKDATPIHRKLIDSIIQSKAHVIATMRSKTEYVMETETNKQGKEVSVPRKIGVAPVQREGMEYEFDVYGSVDWSHQIKIGKSRCPALQDATGIKPGPAFWQPLFDWLTSAKPGKPGESETSIEELTPTPAVAPTTTPVTYKESADEAFDRLAKLVDGSLTIEALRVACNDIKSANGTLDAQTTAMLGKKVQTKKAELAAVAPGGAADPTTKS